MILKQQIHGLLNFTYLLDDATDIVKYSAHLSSITQHIATLV